MQYIAKWRDRFSVGETHHVSELMQMVTLALLASTWLYWRQGDGFWVLNHMLTVGLTFVCLAISAVVLDVDNGVGWDDPEFPLLRGGFFALGIAFWLIANVFTLIVFIAFWIWEPSAGKLAFQFSYSTSGFGYMAAIAIGYTAIRLLSLSLYTGLSRALGKTKMGGATNGRINA